MDKSKVKSVHASISFCLTHSVTCVYYVMLTDITNRTVIQMKEKKQLNSLYNMHCFTGHPYSNIYSAVHDISP